MTVAGVGLVARQEIRTRLRTGRWRVLMGVWFAVVNGLAVLFRLAIEADQRPGEDSAGVPMFGGVLLAVLVLVLLVAPSLSAQSVNGDRERGTLAALQVTRLTAGEIATGKLAASWGTGLVVLLLTMPSVLWPVLEGAVGVGHAAVVLTVMVLLIGIVCAVSQGWSALVARSITSVLLSYVTVFALLVGTPLLYTLALPLSEGFDGDDHSERVWWLLAPNPVVVLADAAPRLPERRIYLNDRVITQPRSDDLLGSIGHEVRRARLGDQPVDGLPGAWRVQEGGPVWPYGLAFDLALAGGALWISARRLRTPMYHVPRAVRIA
ncbi:hypothetical protein [Actinomadura miaoliensis]|uniref:ABC transporter permease n=1 Tax=Actinomadura miaoliensis TaxID=430685 RepID=A0ABP7VT85_9ACTN